MSGSSTFESTVRFHNMHRFLEFGPINTLDLYMGNCMSNHPMMSPTISYLSEILQTASPLQVYSKYHENYSSFHQIVFDSILISENFLKNYKIGHL